MWFQNNIYEHRRYANLTWIRTGVNSLVADNRLVHNESNFAGVFDYTDDENSET